MDKLAQLRVSPEWAQALTACLDTKPPLKRRITHTWPYAIALAAIPAITYYLTH